MNLTKTDTVRAEDERPNRRDGTCFYCFEKIGAPHRPECVIVSKSVVIRLEIEVVVSVPRDWDADMVEFSHNESSSCADNLVEKLGRWAEQDDDDRTCSCHASQVFFIRDATEQDHANLPVLIEAEAQS